jgi:hypothetical protein
MDMTLPSHLKHEELKLRAQNEVKLQSIESRKRRLKILDLIVSRACHFGSQTGEVCPLYL